MYRRIATLSAAVSAVLCVTVLALGFQSFRSEAQLRFSYRGQSYRLLFRSGATVIDNQPEIVAQTAREEKARRAIASVPGSTFLLFVPGGQRVIDPPSHIPLPWSRSSRIPLPAVAALLAFAPAWIVVKRLTRRRRVRWGLCPGCGYDLTGNASGVCPECGSAVAGASRGQ